MTKQTYQELVVLAEVMERAEQFKAARLLREYLASKGKPRPRGRPPVR